MNFETIHYTQEDFVGVLMIQRPQALNALNSKVLNELSIFCEKIKLKKDIRALIITGSGEKAFIAGADIKEMSNMNTYEAKEFAYKGQDIFNKFETFPFPIIAAVNGFALGGGCELALACDIIFASEKAKFALPEVTLGLLPSFGGTQRLARSIGLFKAREMIFTGEFYSAEECCKMGLVNKIFPADKLLIEAYNLAKTIALRAPIAIAKAKEAINDGFNRLLKDGLQQEAHLFSDLFSTQDQKEGLSAFIEKRNPEFKGR